MPKKPIELLPDLLSRLADGYLLAIKGMTGVSVVVEEFDTYEQQTFTAQGEMIGMIDFTGCVVGFLAVSLDEQTIANALGSGPLPPLEQRAEMRTEYEGFLMEVLNSVSGDSLGPLEWYSPITILAPRIIYGVVRYPKIMCLTRRVSTSIGTFYFTVTIDTMQLEINRLADRLKRSEEQLLNAKVELERTAVELREAMEAPSEAIVIHDDGAILDVNEAFSHIFGYDSSNVIGRNLLDFMDAECHELVKQKMSSVSEEPYEAAGRRKDGHIIPVEVRGTAIAYKDRTVRVAALRDLSEHKRVLAALRESERQLRHAQKMEAIGRLGAGVAHDFRNLVALITAQCDFLQLELGEDTPLGQRVGEILEASEKATAMTQQLLALGHRQALQPTVLDLNAVVADLTTMLSRLVGDTVELSVDPAPDLGRIHADRGQIEQIIMNLAVNAGDAMPSGGTLTVTTRNVTLTDAYMRTDPGLPSGRYVLLAVRDTGVGIDAHIQSRVFEPFFTTKQEGKGTGLGLATVYGIAKQSGGSIELESEPGRGSTFMVYLPIADEASTSVAPDGSLAGDAREAK